MKAGLSLQDFAAKIQAQNDSKRDFIVSAPKIKVYSVNDTLEMAFPLKEQTLTDADYFAGKLTVTGHEQIGQWTGIPKAYYQMMMGKGNTELLAKNIQWWADKSSDRRMIRVLDGDVRAVLSDRYRRLDNADLLTAMLPILLEAKADIVTCEVTDRRLYLKALVHQFKAEVVGDVLEAGVIISNSEVGNGALSIKPFAFKLGCLNGMIYDTMATRKYHVGKKAKEDAIEISFTDETNKAVDKAFWLQTRDTVNACLSQVTIDKIAKEMNASAGVKIADPQVAMELLTSKHALNEDESNNVLKHLIEGGSLTSFGLANAVTRMAQDVESFDRSIELESIGYQVMKGNWN